MKRYALVLLPLVLILPLRTSWALTPETPLGHPAAFSVVVEQFPMGIETDDFPVVTLSIEAESTLKTLGLPVLPRAETPAAPYLHLSLTLIRLAKGFVLLTQADLREQVRGSCSGGRVLEVSTWQDRQWQLVRGSAPVGDEVREAARAAIERFAHAYRQ